MAILVFKIFLFIYNLGNSKNLSAGFLEILIMNLGPGF